MTARRMRYAVATLSLAAATVLAGCNSDGADGPPRANAPSAPMPTELNLPASILNTAPASAAPTTKASSPQPLGRACKVLLTKADVARLLGPGAIRKQNDDADHCQYERTAQTFTAAAVNRTDLMPATESAQDYLKEMFPGGQLKHAAVGDAAGYTLDSMVTFGVVVQRGDYLHYISYLVSLSDPNDTPRLIHALTAIANRAVAYA
jgi:hypothetical protein